MSELQDRQRLRRAALGIIAVLLLMASWRWSPLREWLQPERLIEALRDGAQQLGWPLLLLLMSLALSLAIPLVVLTLMSMLAFGPWTGSLYIYAAALSSSAISHLLGRWLGHELLLRLGGARLQGLSQALARRGWLAVTLMRLVPAAPFALVNMLAGATHLRVWHMLVGTALGMAPGTLALAVFADQVQALLRQPGPWRWLMLGLVLLLILLLGALLRRWLRTLTR